MPRKISNPLKYIERLKKQRDEAWQRARELKDEKIKLAGWYLFNYSDPGLKATVSPLSMFNARKVKIGSEIIMRGRVTEIKINSEGMVDMEFRMKNVTYNEEVP